MALVEYDAASDEMVGFVLPDSEPCPKATSVAFVAECFARHSIATGVYSYMLSTSSNEHPPMLLASIPTDNKFTSPDVRERWTLIFKACKTAGINIRFIASDGDARLLSAMLLEARGDAKSFSVLPDTTYSPKRTDFILRFAPSLADFRVYFQDVIHGCLKYMKPVRNGIILKMGAFMISKSSLESVLNNATTVEAFLDLPFLPRDLEAADRQNFPCAFRLFSTETIGAVSKQPLSKGIVIFLTVVNDYCTAFLHPTMPMLERVAKLWSCVTFLRYWRVWAKLENYNVDNVTISRNTFIGIELSSHSFIALLQFCRREHSSLETLNPWTWTSQSCEMHFNISRSYSPQGSSQLNFSPHGYFQRASSLSRENAFRSMKDITKIIYPEHRKHKTVDSAIINFSARRPGIHIHDITEEQVLKAMDAGVDR